MGLLSLSPQLEKSIMSSDFILPFFDCKLIKQIFQVFFFSFVQGEYIHHHVFPPLLLTHFILVNSSTFIYWMSPFVILGGGVSLFCRFYSIFDGKSC